MRKNDRGVVTRLVAACVAPVLVIVAAIISIPPVYHSARAVALVCLYSALLALSCVWLLREIQLRGFLSRFDEGIAKISKGDRAIRFRAGMPADLNGVLEGVNSIASLLEKVHAESSRSETARKNLLSDISHDIRTPLTSIIGYIDALKDDVASGSAEREEYIGILAGKSRALKVMIDDIFSLAKLDADEIPMRPERLDACEAVREVLIEFLPAFRSLGVSLEADIPETPCMAVADRTSLARIARNLIQNALQHGRDGGWIRVSVGQSNGVGASTVSVSVADRGPGIPERDLERVFTRLYRRDAARTGAAEGSGLGLAIVQSLARANGGLASARSVPGGETVFEVSFPAAISGDLRKS
ncbi:MAG TPA: HAMP domain-containing sensor histidine kinase [Treponemataceae bacterium]|nr:HAMP domain-containing sensor histidine kinase [Treponemataceae bacterium]